MAVVLYKAGNETVVDGVPCISEHFEVRFMAGALAAGYVNCPKKLYADKAVDDEKKVIPPIESPDIATEEPEPMATIEPVKEEAIVDNGVKLPVDDNKAIRLAAQKAGIVGFENKRISTLKAELRYDA